MKKDKGTARAEPELPIGEITGHTWPERSLPERLLEKFRREEAARG